VYLVTLFAWAGHINLAALESSQVSEGLINALLTGSHMSNEYVKKKKYVIGVRERLGEDYLQKDTVEPLYLHTLYMHNL